MFVLLTTTTRKLLPRHARFDFRKGYIVVVKESLEEIYDKIRK